MDSRINTENEIVIFSFLARLPALIHTQPSPDDKKNQGKEKTPVVPTQPEKSWKLGGTTGVFSVPGFSFSCHLDWVESVDQCGLPCQN